MSLKNALLGILTYGPMSGYDLKAIFDKSINQFWNAGVSQIYRDLGNLESEGCVSSQIVPQKGRPDRKVYTITETGKEVFANWLNQFPSDLNMPVRYDFLLRIFFGARIPPEDLKFQLQKYIKGKQEIVSNLLKARDNIEKLPVDCSDVDKFYWGLTGKMGYLLSEASIKWAEECITEIDEFIKVKNNK